MVAKFDKNKKLILQPQSYLEEMGLKQWLSETGETKDDVTVENYFDIDDLLP